MSSKINSWEGKKGGEGCKYIHICFNFTYEWPRLWKCQYFCSSHSFIFRYSGVTEKKEKRKETSTLTHLPPFSFSSQLSEITRQYEHAAGLNVTHWTSLNTCLQLVVISYTAFNSNFLYITQNVVDEPGKLTALIFFHCRSNSAFSLVSLKRRVFRPSDILMPYWKAAL